MNNVLLSARLRIADNLGTSRFGQHYAVTEDLSAKIPFIPFTRPHYELLHALTFTRGCSLDEGRTPAPDVLSHHLGESWDLTPSKPRSYKSSARISAASS